MKPSTLLPHAKFQCDDSKLRFVADCTKRFCGVGLSAPRTSPKPLSSSHASSRCRQASSARFPPPGPRRWDRPLPQQGQLEQRPPKETAPRPAHLDRRHCAPTRSSCRSQSPPIFPSSPCGICTHLLGSRAPGPCSCVKQAGSFAGKRKLRTKTRATEAGGVSDLQAHGRVRR
jgi:hypothetical protein